ncbi:uncharacterized protein [Solanum tuberosum]|uniref:uncharacterized protein isoform X1 n=1 Tax=Solanum tuberosum TaxID=4113 RepID=UPI00073A1AB1|nr:PREDICTED: uncharacterized protein LOC102591629 isoform X1 [Solanum tuberosum]
MLPSWTNSALCLFLLGIINVMLMCFLVADESANKSPLASVPPFPFPPIAAHYLPANGHVTECKGSSAPPPFKSVVGFLQSWWERRFGRRWVIDLCIPKIMRVLLDFETVEKMSRAENKLLKHVRCCCLFLRVFYSSFCFTLQVSC